MAENDVPIEVTMPDMDLSDAESEKLPSVGWHPAMLIDVLTAYKKEDLELPEKYRRRNYILIPELHADDPEMPGYKNLGKIYIPMPTPAEIEFNAKFKSASKEAKKSMMLENPEMVTKDGRTKCAQKMAWIKQAATCFGGKETGKFDKNFFSKQIGQKFMIDVVHEAYQGDPQARVSFMGIKPA